MSTLYSLQLEKHVLGGLIKNPELVAEILPYLTENDFYSEVNSTIFLVIKNCISNRETIDPVLLANKIKGLGISFKDGINVFDYLEGISFTQIQSDAVLAASKELLKLRICRELEETGKKIQSTVKTNITKGIDEIVGACDKAYSERISSYELNSKPVNIFENVEKIVEERGNSPVEDVGLLTQFDCFNTLFGGLRPKNLYSFVSRPGQGKSTLLASVGFGVAQRSNFTVPFLLLDTEMETEDIRWRTVSSLSGVPMWYLETGNWRKNGEMVDKVRKALSLMKDYRFLHYKVGNKTIDEICSFIRRWYYSEVGRGNTALISYDYIKLTGEKVSESWKEYQAIGDKVDKLKKIGEEVGCPILIAMQLNRSGENFNKQSKDVTDDSSVIATSDRLQWFSTYVGIFRRKTLDEIELDGRQFGTHKLIHIKTRFQGKDSAGHHDIVRRKISKDEYRFENNYLSFEVDNFRVSEKGSLRDIADFAEQKFKFKSSDEDVSL